MSVQGRGPTQTPAVHCPIAGAVRAACDTLARSAAQSTRGYCQPENLALAIARLQVCPSEVSQHANSLPDFCPEPLQGAVNWSLDQATPKRVSVADLRSLRAAAPQSGRPELNISGAMQTTLRGWTSGDLGSEVDAFLAKSVSRSDHFMLLVALQVIKMVCQDDANLIVRLSQARGDDFSMSDADYLAKSQIEGRTLLVNAADHKFSYSLSRKTETGAFDPITVFAHELGHSSGMPDKYLRRSNASIMNPEKLALERTEQDAKDLAKALEKSLQGTTAGYVNAVRRTKN